MRESVMPGPLGAVTVYICRKQCGRYFNKSTVTKDPKNVRISS